MRYILLILLFSTISCTPQKKLARLCRNYPLLCETTTDTIFKIRMIPKLDTVKVVEHQTLIDTFEVTNGRATTRVVVKRDTVLKRDSVLVTLEQVPDTIIQIKVKEVVKYRSKDWKWGWIFATALLLILGLWRLTR